jgi:nucleotide-binding universal stress UspA family protein
MIAIKNVLVATDFGTASETALVYARALAQTFGATLHAIHVVEDIYAYMIGGEGTAMTGIMPRPLKEDLERKAAADLDRFLSDSDRQDLHARTIVNTSSSAALEIVTYAKQANIDIIVIGTHGRGAFSRMLMGSVAEKVVRTAPCPVLTVKHPEHEFVSPESYPIRHDERAS